MSFSPLSRAIKIFFSYATSAPRDKNLFDQLMAHLSILKREQLIDEFYDSAICAGSNITQFMEAQLKAADIIVLLLSAEFFASERCYGLELKRALELSASGTKRLIPVILRPADWKILPLSQYSPLPPDGKPVSRWSDIDEALSEVARGIRRVVEELANQTLKPHADMPSPQLPLHYIPYRYNTFFTDRQKVLATLSSAFASTKTPQIPILALNGLGGMGKTQVALAYTYRSLEMYQIILWLNASSRKRLSAEVSALADLISLPQKEHFNETQLFAAVKRWLQSQPNWLLVLDQIEDISLLDLLTPTQGNGHVLLTTRTQATGTLATALPIAKMTSMDSVLFLLRRAKIISVDAELDQAPAEAIQEANAIAREMDGFPLALDQAGAYLEETGCGLTTYLTLYHKERMTLLGQRGKNRVGHTNSVTVTLTLTFEKVAQKRATNLDLLHLLAFMQPDAIPDELLVKGADELDEPLQSLAAHPLNLHQALAELLNFSLIQRRTDTSMLYIHRIVQIVLKDTLSQEQQRQLAIQVVRMVNRVFPEIRFDTQAACERYLPQAQNCAKLIADFQLTLKEAALLLERVGTYCYRHACYSEAEATLTQALDLYEQHLKSETLDMAQTLNSLALLRYRQARYQQAETLHLRALKLREQALDSDHLKTAESLHNLAMLYANQGHYQQAEHFYRRVLAIENSMREVDHSEIARTLNNLGLVYYRQGQYQQAEATYQQALTIYEGCLPPDHPDLIHPLDGLGALNEKQGNYSRAQELYQRALSICQQAYGDQHPETAHSLNKLADIYEIEGNYRQAAALYHRALSIVEQTLGSEHPDAALFLNNLAFLAEKERDYQQAENLYQRALHLYEQSLGTEHPFIATVLNNLGKLYQNMGNIQRAEALLRKAIAICKRVSGLAHPDTALSMGSLAELLSAEHHYEEAEVLFQQAFAILLQAFGPQHGQVNRMLEKYVALLESMGRTEEAAILRQTLHQKPA
ncbi:toll/interleukin-1 receptor domain-containing protein [Ktedonosporobacter rubrisoli]|uniref:Toll/interleukin-1 receptor domain-containing protein n=1 Tax=Ktedonosporobacter rubrisoli TaxID=2509675 RepID=A0A4P6JRH3_KTERU|nr:toll/interleukin-1 receptor domain-containing protein [Ktedonosporobacter rubrisoli]QBD77802.1 toll/interleukin-1 receptor domain-containing protein [Ktedonosporobacter rubrisoli]